MSPHRGAWGCLLGGEGPSCPLPRAAIGLSSASRVVVFCSALLLCLLGASDSQGLLQCLACEQPASRTLHQKQACFSHAVTWFAAGRTKKWVCDTS